MPVLGEGMVKLRVSGTAHDGEQRVWKWIRIHRIEAEDLTFQTRRTSGGAREVWALHVRGFT